jgi:hypothetical protein
MADYTEKVLLFWRSNAPKFPAWGHLARVFLSIAPSSAAVERVFSLKPPTGRIIILLRNHKVEVSHNVFLLLYERKACKYTNHHQRCMGRRWLLPVPINSMSMVSYKTP